MSDKEPSIYIIGGLPRTGKTTVGERLSHDLRIGMIETDHIRVLFMPTVNSKLRPDSAQPIPVVTKKMRPRLESLIGSMAQSHTNFVMNGECIDPYMIVESPHRDLIRSCFMGLDNADAAFNRIRSISDTKDWAMQKSDEELRAILDKYAARSQELGRTCFKLGIPYLDASFDFTATNTAAYDLLSGMESMEAAV